MSTEYLPGAEPWSHVGSGDRGALVLHGFTGNPSSVRGLADAFAAAGWHVELPCHPGHGTTAADLLDKRWNDWADSVAASLTTLRQRADKIVVAGLSMGGTLTLHLGAEHPELAGLICVNPLAQHPGTEITEMVRDFLSQGMEMMPGIGSDLADPDASESAYPETPLRALLSLFDEGVGPLTERYGRITTPLLLMTSLNDHVVDPAQSDALAAAYGGPVERVSLERSYHVATQDYDRDLINERALAFGQRVTS